MSLDLAKALIEYGFKVFPVNHTEDNEKKPYTSHGHHDATLDIGLVEDWWSKWPTAKVGVPAGVNGVVVADVDVKNGKDGFTSLDENWYTLPETFAYDTATGGRHFIYQAPEGVTLNGQSNYRGLVGVDRRGGESWVLWAGDAPSAPISPAPEWLCDEVSVRDLTQFEGTIKEWYDTLTPGSPNALVRKALQRAEESFRANGNDFSHSDMIEHQFELVRLGSEGNPGAGEGLAELEELFLSREGAHTRPEEDWGYEWAEALESAIARYGEPEELVKNLPEYNLGVVPPTIPNDWVIYDTGKSGFSRLLGALVENLQSDDRVASILWNCPATTELAREWGLQFVYRRISEARTRPEPTRENPAVEEEREQRRVLKGGEDLALLTAEEREYLKSRPTFVDHVVETAKGFGYDQVPYFRSVGWVSAAMAFSFRGFIMRSPTHKMGVNLWAINLGGSGTGKSVTGGFRDAILKTVFSGDPEDIVPFDLGDDSSPQGLHTALIERDRRASLFSADEAAGFFASLGLNDWRTSIEERLTSWYGGYVQASNKLSQKEYRGKNALTALSMHMFGTPDKVTEIIIPGMFESGFMARVNWVFGLPPKDDDSRFNIEVYTPEEDVEFDGSAKELVAHGVDLLMATGTWEKPRPIKAEREATVRLSEAYKRMYRLSENRENWHMVEPSLTRLSESLLKMSAISAMYRGDDHIILDDALHAIRGMEEYFQNLHRVVGMIAAGDFQRTVEDVVEYVKAQGGTVTRSKIMHRFRSVIKRDYRELDSVLQFTVESGRLNRSGDTEIKYTVNGE